MKKIIIGIVAALAVITVVALIAVIMFLDKGVKKGIENVGPMLTYMSPEQLAARRIEGRSDLYSLGVTLYHLACGRLPFEGDSMAQLVYRIRNDPPANILRVRPDLPPRIVQVNYRAMMKMPEQRYRDGKEMGRALRECAATLAGTAR